MAARAGSGGRRVSPEDSRQVKRRVKGIGKGQDLKKKADLCNDSTEKGEKAGYTA